MECVSRDQLGPASSVPAYSVLVLLVCVCGGEEMVTPANNSDEVAFVALLNFVSDEFVKGAPSPSCRTEADVIVSSRKDAS